MTLTELRYIIAVARDRHFGHAAKRCFVSQPTLSLGIKKLEQELGVALFERGSREVIITPEGNKIVEQAKKVMSEINAIKDIASYHRPLTRSPLRIGAIHTVGPYLFPSLLPVIRDLRPGLPMLIEENYTTALTERLHNGEIDMAIVSLPYEEQGLDSLALYDEPFVALLPSSHTLTAYNELSLKRLAQETVLLLGPQHCFRDQVLEICPDCIQSVAKDDSLQNTLEGSSLETIRYMVASGVGVTIIPAMAACAEKYSQRLVAIRRFNNSRAHRRIALVWRRGFPRTELIELLVTAIHACGLSGIHILGNEEPAPENLSLA